MATENSSSGAAIWLLRANVVSAVGLGAVLLCVGRFGDSSTLVAEGWHTLGDGVLGLLCVYCAVLSARGADAEHPYGRAKFEHLAGAVMGGVLLMLAAEMTLDFVGHWLTGGAHRPSFSSTTTAVLLSVAGARCAWAIVLLTGARRAGSVALEVEARHARMDAFVTSAAVGAAIAGQWFPWSDVAGGLAVIVVVSITGVSLLRDHAPWLADRSVVPSESIERAVAGFSGELTLRRARSRGTPDQAFVEVVVEASEASTFGDVSALARGLEDHIRREIPEAVEVVVVAGCGARK